MNRFAIDDFFFYFTFQIQKKDDKKFITVTFRGFQKWRDCHDHPKGYFSITHSPYDFSLMF